MKKLILITLIVGLVGFGSMFAAGWFTKPRPVDDPSPSSQNPQGTTENGLSQTPTVLTQNTSHRSELTMTDRELQTLIFEVREKIKDYNEKLASLEVREQRLQSAQQTLKQDIQDMQGLRVELAAAVVSIKNEQEQLLKSRVKVEKNEQENLLSLAAAYDKMDPESAGKILMNMVKSQGTNENADDAIKILYYMSERTKAKVLAVMADTEPTVSAYLCQKIKRMVTTE